MTRNIIGRLSALESQILHSPEPLTDLQRAIRLANIINRKSPDGEQKKNRLSALLSLAKNRMESPDA